MCVEDVGFWNPHQPISNTCLELDNDPIYPLPNLSIDTLYMQHEGKCMKSNPGQIFDHIVSLAFLLYLSWLWIDFWSEKYDQTTYLDSCHCKFMVLLVCV